MPPSAVPVRRDPLFMWTGPLFRLGDGGVFLPDISLNNLRQSVEEYTDYPSSP